jgi:hypothetical protein
VTEFTQIKGIYANWTDIHGIRVQAGEVQLRKGRKKEYSEETDKGQGTQGNSR